MLSFQGYRAIDDPKLTKHYEQLAAQFKLEGLFPLFKPTLRAEDVTTTRSVQATPMMKDTETGDTGRESGTECMASELAGVQLTVSAAELEEQKKLVLDRDQTIADLNAQVSVLQQMHLSVIPRTMAQEPTELREQATASRAAASARTPAAATPSEVECRATDQPPQKKVKLVRDFLKKK